MTVKERREELFNLREANYSKQFITTFILYLSLRSVDSNIVLRNRIDAFLLLVIL